MSQGNKEGLAVVPIHEKGKVLRAKYLTDLESSIKGRTPLKGVNIDILYLDGGAVISVTGLTAITGNPIALTVCSNGQPTVVTVVGYSN